jgi:hypothetical protein
MRIASSIIDDEVLLTLPIRRWLVDNVKRLTQHRRRYSYCYMPCAREVVQSREVPILTWQRITPTLNPCINALIVAHITCTHMQSQKQTVSQRTSTCTSTPDASTLPVCIPARQAWPGMSFLPSAIDGSLAKRAMLP